MKKTSQQNSQIWFILLWSGGITILISDRSGNKTSGSITVKGKSGYHSDPRCSRVAVSGKQRNGFWNASGATDSCC